MKLYNIPKENYYSKMYDIENLTYLNKGRKKSNDKDLLKIEDLIKNNNCKKAKQLIKKNLTNKEIYKELNILYGALFIKEILNNNLYKNEKEEYSPKSLALLELKDYLKKPISKFIFKTVVELPVKEAWNKLNPNTKDEEDINKFYMITDAYIYELMAANYIVQTLYSYYVLAQKLKSKNITTILDYGAGAGTLSILFKELGYNVIYADLPGKTFNFAKWRFKQRGLDIKMIKIKDRNFIKDIKFDCILCTEVIEHVVNPLKYLKDFKNVLNKGEILIVSESCEYTDDFSSHLSENKKYGGKRFIEIMSKLNFKQIYKSPFIPQMIFEKK
jgi:SAM-dependent methyltransferase